MEIPFYKRKWVLILAVLVGFLLLILAVTAATVSARRQKELNATPTPSTIPTEAPTPTPLPNYHALAFDPDLSKMEGMNAVPEEYREELGREWWVDITPANEAMTGYTLFRHVELGYSFLLLPDGRYLRLGEQTQGCGVVNAVYGDLDADDGWELLYAYTAESEDGPAARVGWLDLTTLENRTASFLLKNGALALAENGGRLLLYRASLADTDSRGFYAIDFIAPLGELLERDGALFLELE
jgi:hypothetical protein